MFRVQFTAESVRLRHTLNRGRPLAQSASRHASCFLGVTPAVSLGYGGSGLAWYSSDWRRVRVRGVEKNFSPPLCWPDLMSVDKYAVCPCGSGKKNQVLQVQRFRLGA